MREAVEVARREDDERILAVRLNDASVRNGELAPIEGSKEATKLIREGIALSEESMRIHTVVGSEAELARAYFTGAVRHYDLGACPIFR
jgi:hypothetical protein